MVSYAAEETVDPTRTIPRALVAGTLDRHGAVRRAQRGLPADPAARHRRAVVARRGGFRGRRGGRARRADHVRAGHPLHARRDERRDPRRPARLPRDGERRPAVPVGRLGASRLPDAAPRDRAAGRVVVRARRDGLVRACCSRASSTPSGSSSACSRRGCSCCGGEPDYAPPYRVWGYPLLPALFVISTAAIVINQVVAQPAESVGGLLFVLLGLPVYYIWASKAAKTEVRRPSSRQRSASRDLP